MVIIFFQTDVLLIGAPASALTRLDTHHPQKHHLLLRPHVELQYVQQHQRGRPPCQHIGLVKIRIVWSENIYFSRTLREFFFFLILQ